MKIKTATAAAFLAFSLTLAAAEGQTTINPATGEPVNNGEAAPAIDPVTGLPVGSEQEAAQRNHMKQRIAALQDSSWKDPNWKDPDIVVTNINYEGVPLSEVARDVREHFKEQFDIILPNESIMIGNVQGVPLPAVDEQIELHLKDVNASELFSAMNLLFENNLTPLRWELKVVGNRQIAVLHALSNPNVPQAPMRIDRRIYFIGDLIGDEKTGGMSMDQIIQTVEDIWRMTDTTGGSIQFHKNAQLLIVSGTSAQNDYVFQTLKALRDKVELARRSLARSQPPAAPQFTPGSSDPSRPPIPPPSLQPRPPLLPNSKPDESRN